MNQVHKSPLGDLLLGGKEVIKHNIYENGALIDFSAAPARWRLRVARFIHFHFLFFRVFSSSRPLRFHSETQCCPLSRPFGW